MFGLTALAAVAAMAFIGATSASAEKNTALCKTHTSLLCPAGDVWKAGELIHLLNEGVGKLLSSLITVLCLLVLVSAESLGLTEAPTPLPVHGTISFSGCGSTSAHDNCTATVEEQPLSHLLKTGLDAGTLLALNGRTRLICEDLTIFKIDIDCKYDTTGIL